MRNPCTKYSLFVENTEENSYLNKYKISSSHVSCLAMKTLTADSPLCPPTLRMLWGWTNSRKIITRYKLKLFISFLISWFSYIQPKIAPKPQLLLERPRRGERPGGCRESLFERFVKTASASSSSAVSLTPHTVNRNTAFFPGENPPPSRQHTTIWVSQSLTCHRV